MTDILLNDENDLSIVDGDFQTGDSIQQEIEAVLIAFKGEFKLFPLLGAELPRMIKSRSTKQGIIREIKAQLQYDGMTRIEVLVNDSDNYTINAIRNGTE